MAEVSIEQFAAAHADGASVVDVREPMEYVDGHVPGAALIPMGQLASRTGELEPSRPVYVICATGNRSSAMTSLLRHVGFDAYSVSGGTSAWVRSGRPVIAGSRASAA